MVDFDVSVNNSKMYATASDYVGTWNQRDDAPIRKMNDNLRPQVPKNCLGHARRYKERRDRLGRFPHRIARPTPCRRGTNS